MVRLLRASSCPWVGAARGCIGRERSRIFRVRDALCTHPRAIAIRASVIAVNATTHRAASIRAAITRRSTHYINFQAAKSEHSGQMHSLIGSLFSPLTIHLFLREFLDQHLDGERKVRGDDKRSRFSSRDCANGAQTQFDECSRLALTLAASSQGLCSRNRAIRKYSSRGRG